MDADDPLAVGWLGDGEGAVEGRHRAVGVQAASASRSTGSWPSTSAARRGGGAVALLLFLLLAHQRLDPGDLGLGVGELLVALERLPGRGDRAVVLEREPFDASFEQRFALGEVGDRLEQRADQDQRVGLHRGHGRRDLA